MIVVDAEAAVQVAATGLLLTAVGDDYLALSALF
jgi:hypothetical protein